MNRTTISRMACVAVLLAGVAAAHAQTMRDPTRPPGASATRAGPLAATTDLVLQSVLISPERKTVVISGKVMGPGESVGGFMLVGIAEGEVVLKNGSEVRRLRLYPSVDMRRQKEMQGGTSGGQSGSGDRQ